MAVVVAALVARGTTQPGEIPPWVRLTIGFALAAGTVLGAQGAADRQPAASIRVVRSTPSTAET